MAGLVDHRPMLATPSTSAGGRAAIDIETLNGTHVFDLKMDGIRAFARWDGLTLTLTNRSGDDISHRYPELVESAAQVFDLPVWLDGEIVANDGRFETTLTRDKQNNPAAIRMHAAAHPVMFFAFDLPLFADHGWLVRRAMLDDLLPAGLFVPTPYSFHSGFLEQTRAQGLEGVIAKRLDVGYQFGARSKSWVKFKNLHRVTCLVAGYEPGTGARTHFGKMNLALIDTAGQVVHCGSVGTGFSNREILELKDLLDRGEILVVEIETLNRTSGGTLRFPVYKGRRLDLSPADCTIDQLDALPAC